MKSYLSVFFLCYSCFWCHVHKFIAKFKSMQFTPFFSSKNFLAFSSLFKPLIHFELLCYVVWGRLKLHSLSCEWMPSGPSTISWRDYSLHWLLLAPSSKMNWSQLYESLNSVLFHNVFVIQGLLHFHVNLKIGFSISANNNNKTIQILIRIR